MQASPIVLIMYSPLTQNPADQSGAPGAASLLRLDDGHPGAHMKGATWKATGAEIRWH